MPLAPYLLILCLLATGCASSFPHVPEERLEFEIDSAARLAAFAELEAMRPARPPRKEGRCEWSFAGPSNLYGRVTGIAIDPTNGERMFLSTVGGIWRSENGARSWERVSNGVLASVWGSVAVNPADPAEVFAGGGDPNIRRDLAPRGPGIFRSTAGGGDRSWTKVSPPELDLSIVFRLRVTADGTVYAATDQGVWIGTRSGSSIAFARLGGFARTTNDLAIDESVTPALVYAGAEASGVWLWNGISWSQMDNGIGDDRGVITLALARSAPSTLFAKVTKRSGEALLGIYKTTDGARTWTQLFGISQSTFAYWNALIEVDPVNANNVYAGTDYLFGSSDGGATWRNISGGVSGQLILHVDQHALAFDPRNPMTVIVGNDGGVARSDDPGTEPRTWTAISAGLNITQLYGLATQGRMPTLLAGGSQDNGWEISFGNRAWFAPIGGDGHHLAVDGVNPDVIYGSYKTSTTFEYSSPVPFVPGYPAQITWSGSSPYGPYATDPSLRGAALAQTRTDQKPVRIVRTIDGVRFEEIATLPDGVTMTAIAIAPDSAFRHYYVALSSGAIWRTADAGATWMKDGTGLLKTVPTSIAVDAADANRAFATAQGAANLFATSDGGATWVSMGGGLPSTASLTGVVFDPFDPAIIYVASNVGPFRGTLRPDGSMEWEPFDEGLPLGAELKDIEVSRETGVLTVATYGNGAYQRDLRRSAVCRDALLVVRDNVFDRGAVPSPTNLPDPQYPIADPSRAQFFMPDDTRGGRVYWWTSSDIRVDVPSRAPLQNRVAEVNQPSFETCAPEAPRCPPGTILNAEPRPGDEARVFVQATNYGRERVRNVRVLALWTRARVVPPELPPDFWTSTFRADGTCGPLAAGEWKTFGAEPCRFLDAIDPDLPAIAQFDWSVPAEAAGPYAYLAIVDSPADPIDPSVRARDVREIWRLAPDERHVAYRSLELVEEKKTRTLFADVLRLTETAELMFSRVSFRGELFFAGRADDFDLQDGRRRRLPAELRALAIEKGVDPEVAFVPAGREPRVTVEGEGALAILAVVDAPSRLAVIATIDGLILGGMQWLIRGEP